jgi:hypothetical protein
MSELIDKHQWEIRAAYRLGWEIRAHYYERLLRNTIELLEGAQDVMKVDDMSDAIRSLGRALVELEETWAMVARWKTEQMARRTGQRLVDRSGHDPDEAS